MALQNAHRCSEYEKATSAILLARCRTWYRSNVCFVHRRRFRSRQQAAPFDRTEWQSPSPTALRCTKHVRSASCVRERASRAGRYSRTNTSEQLANLLDVAKEQRFGNSQHQDVLGHRRAHQHQITGTLFDATIQCRRTGTKLASVFSQISRQRPSGVRPSNCTFGIVVCLVTINTDTPDRERESVCVCPAIRIMNTVRVRSIEKSYSEQSRCPAQDQGRRYRTTT